MVAEHDGEIGVGRGHTGAAGIAAQHRVRAASGARREAPGRVNQFQERAWFDHGSHGARPGIPVGGVIDLPAASEA